MYLATRHKVHKDRLPTTWTNNVDARPPSFLLNALLLLPDQTGLKKDLPRVKIFRKWLLDQLAW